jgi:hypothetical protein
MWLKATRQALASIIVGSLAFLGLISTTTSVSSSWGENNDEQASNLLPNCMLPYFTDDKHWNSILLGGKALVQIQQREKYGLMPRPPALQGTG